MIVFRELEQAINKTKNNMKSSNLSDQQLETENLKLSALYEIIGYCRSMEWVKQEQLKDKVRYFLKHRFNYEKTATHFGTTKNAMEVSMSDASKKFRNTIGDDTITQILEGNIQESIKQFRMNTTSNHISAELLLPGVLNLLPDVEKDIIPHGLEDCQKEINILMLYSTFHAGDVLKGRDQKKLAHILYILNSSSKKLERERELLIKLLNGHFQKGEDGCDRNLKQQMQTALHELNEDNVFYSD